MSVADVLRGGFLTVQSSSWCCPYPLNTENHNKAITVFQAQSLQVDINAAGKCLPKAYL